MKEAVLVLIKPDALKKSLTGDILSRLSKAELEIIGAKVLRVNEELAKEHYSHLSDKPFFDEVIKYIIGDLHNTRRVMALVYYGEDAIKKLREIAGATNPEEALPTSIRGSYGRITTTGVYENVIHVSDSPENAEKEIKLWFSPEEIVYDIYPSKIMTLGGLNRRVWA